MPAAGGALGGGGQLQEVAEERRLWQGAPGGHICNKHASYNIEVEILGYCNEYLMLLQYKFLDVASAIDMLGVAHD